MNRPARNGIDQSATVAVDAGFGLRVSGKGRCLDAGPNLNAEGMRRPAGVGIHLATRAARQTHEQGRRLKAKIDRDRVCAS
jgi:hypothetical protein